MPDVPTEAYLQIERPPDHIQDSNVQLVLCIRQQAGSCLPALIVWLIEANVQLQTSQPEQLFGFELVTALLFQSPHHWWIVPGLHQ